MHYYEHNHRVYIGNIMGMIIGMCCQYYELCKQGPETHYYGHVQRGPRSQQYGHGQESPLWAILWVYSEGSIQPLLRTLSDGLWSHYDVRDHRGLYCQHYRHRQRVMVWASQV